MQWTDVIAPPPRKVLRQFAGLWLVLLTGWAGWRLSQGLADPVTWSLLAAGLGLGVPGLIRPSVMRPVFTGWMVVVFPIGWTVSRVVLAGLFYLMFTPVALVFRLMGRDALSLRRGRPASYWRPKPAPSRAEDYFRQF